MHDENAVSGEDSRAGAPEQHEAGCEPAVPPAGAASGQAASADDDSESGAEVENAPADGVETTDGDEAERQPRLRVMTRREAVFVAIAAVSLVVAAACAVLYAGAYVPPDAAAKADGSYIAESRVSEWIGQYRAANSLQGDDEFGSALLSQGKNVSTFRQEAINQLVLNDLVEDRAAELGIVPTDEDAQRQLAATKESLSLGDDEVWQETLDMYNLSEEGLIAQYKTNLARQAVLETDVAHRAAGDEEVLAYIKRNLAGTTQKHAYRIIFTGGDSKERASECYAELKKLGANGELTTESFANLAAEYSDEESASETGGAYAWSGSGMSTEMKDIVGELDEGALSPIEEVEEDGALEIVFCDDAYEFPAASGMSDIPADVPPELLDEVRDAASDSLWQEDCDGYLAALLAHAKITYYPIPDGAAYNVPVGASA